MPCSEDTFEEEKTDREDCDKDGPFGIMCVPINVRFFDASNTRPITQVVGGESFVVRVNMNQDGEDCRGTQINLTHLATAAPSQPGPIPGTGAPASSFPVPDPVISLNPPPPLRQFSSNGGLYTFTKVSTNPVLNATSLTIRATNPRNGPTKENTITIVRTAADLQTTSEAEGRHEQETGVPPVQGVMCVPINVRFFDPVSSQQITQVKAGQPFVVRVDVRGPVGDTCQGTNINLTYMLAVSPNTVATVGGTAAFAEQAVNAAAVAVPVTLLAQSPAGPLTQVYMNGTQPYLGATLTPSTALSGTTLTVTAKNPLKTDTFSGTILIVP